MFRKTLKIFREMLKMFRETLKVFRKTLKMFCMLKVSTKYELKLLINPVVAPPLMQLFCNK